MVAEAERQSLALLPTSAANRKRRWQEEHWARLARSERRRAPGRERRGRRHVVRGSEEEEALCRSFRVVAGRQRVVTAGRKLLQFVCRSFVVAKSVGSARRVSDVLQSCILVAGQA